MRKYKKVFKTRNANLEKVTYCKFGVCPNRFKYITRPAKLAEVFQ